MTPIHSSIWSADLYRKTIDFAAAAHGKQKVPGKPYSYVVHLASVAMEVVVALRTTSRTNVNLAICCALLHDVLEDTRTPPVEVEEVFGRDVYMGVAALTKSKSLPKLKGMMDSLKRIKREPKEIGMVKMADGIVNLQQPPQRWTLGKARAYHKEAKLILQELSPSNAYLAKRLRRKITEYEIYL